MDQPQPDNSEGASISVFLHQLAEGNSAAAQPLWERYYGRLVGLARRKLGDAPRCRVDEEDVVVSAFDTFCRRAQAGNFPDLRDRDGLWPLLALITARKAAQHRRREGRAKRGGGRQNGQPFADRPSDDPLAEALSSEPTPSEVAIFLSELERFMESLDDPASRSILLWKLEERTNPEIAELLQCSLSAVERKLRFIRRRLDRTVNNTSSD